MSPRVGLHAPRQLLDVAAPFLYMMDAPDGVDLRGHIRRCGLSAFGVRGERMRDVSGLFDEFAAALQFPTYFGRNWAAFNECLGDLGWFELWPSMVLTVFQPSQVLAEADATDLASLVQSFDLAVARFREPVVVGEAYDRPAIAFHVVLQCQAENDLARWRDAGCMPDELDASQLLREEEEYFRWRRHIAGLDDGDVMS